MRATLFCLPILLITLALPAAEGMFPVNGVTPAIAAEMKAMGCRFDPADLWRPGEKCLAMAVVNLGAHRLVRLGRRLDHHQPPRGLRRRAEPLLARAQLHPRRLPRRRPRAGSPRSRLQRAGHDRLRERHPPLPRGHAPGTRRGKAPTPGRKDLQGAGGRGREDPGQRVRRGPLLRRPGVLPGDLFQGPRHARGLRSGALRRRVRRRGGQLDVAAPYRRFFLPARLCRQGRPPGRLLQGQCPLPAAAPFPHRQDAAARRRLHHDPGLSRHDQTLAHGRRSGQRSPGRLPASASPCWSATSSCSKKRRKPTTR